MKKGWFCFHREHLDLPIGSSLELVGAWAMYQAAASHDGREFFLGTQKISLKKGEFIWGERSWGEKMRISPSRARRILKIFESEELISINATNKFTLVKVKNWEKLQTKPPKSEEQKTSEKRADEDQKKLNNNSNNFEQFKPEGVDEKIFLVFARFIRDRASHIKNPGKYAARIFSNYPSDVVRRACEDSTTTSWQKFNENLKRYLARARKRGDTLANV